MPRKYTERGLGGYTNLATGQLRGLAEARASGTEFAAYAMLTRYHHDPEHPARCWVSAQMAADELGLRPDSVTRALNALTRKEFALGGEALPVLAKVSDGHNGRAAVYCDNLYAVAVLRDGSQVARQNRRATRPSSKADSACYSHGVARQIVPSSKADSPSQIRELLQQAAAVPPAQHSGGGAIPPEVATQEWLDTMGREPRASAGAARGRPAAALPPRAEYDRVRRKLADEGLDSLTVAEREAFHAGWPAYECR